MEKLNRKEIEENIAFSTASILSKEQHQSFMKYIHNLTDEQFEKISDSIHHDNGNNISFKQMKEIESNIIFNSDNSTINSGYSNIHVEFMNPEANKILWDSINKSKPTDIIVSDEETNMKIADIWCKKEKSGIPSDIFFMNTIPIMDMYIDIKLALDIEKTLRFRIVIFSNYQNLISNNDPDDPVTIGAIIAHFNCSSIVSTIDVLKGYDYLMSGIELGYKNLSETTRKQIEGGMNVAEIQSVMCDILAAWYGIQISCLHPTVKEIFSKGRISVLEDNTNKHGNKKINKNKKKKVKYVKRHYITIDDINEKFNSSYNRKSLCWYVTGHWRTYKTGKKVFIKPYWKGILRESKNTEIREREVDTTVTID